MCFLNAWRRKERESERMIGKEKEKIMTTTCICIYESIVNQSTQNGLTNFVLRRDQIDESVMCLI